MNFKSTEEFLQYIDAKRKNKENLTKEDYEAIRKFRQASLAVFGSKAPKYRTRTKLHGFWRWLN